MTSAQHIEVTLRAAQVAQSALEMINISEICLARMQSIRIATLLQDLDNCLQRIEHPEAGRPPKP